MRHNFATVKIFKMLLIGIAFIYVKTTFGFHSTKIPSNIVGEKELREYDEGEKKDGKGHE